MANIPLRMCVVCRQMKPKTDLIRVSKNKNNEISADFDNKKGGRGAYICKNKACIERLEKTRGFKGSLKANLPEDVVSQIKKGLIE